MTTPAWRNAETTGASNSPFQTLPTTRLDDWLAIAPDGVVTLFCGKVELGTGIRTALDQIIADELDVSLASVRVVMGDTGRVPNEGYTAGSKSVQTFWTSARVAAAEARRALLTRAAERLGADPADLLTSDGAVVHRADPQRRVTYGELLAGGGFDCDVTGDAPLKSASAYKAIGQTTERLDLAEKFFGGASYVHD
ncbi:MAG: molybdopterin-dependent oxidoreductase, partial [Chloroflexota bacterium]|nr:molybdopterin-dependent oxidoreductase [Chloroflexota bacterium]